jgi:prolipoprotein diacylglyceryl transferase
VSDGVLTALGVIPSPGFDRLGPLRIYGLMIALGVIAGVWLARKRWAERGGDPDDISTIALWAVPAGLVGARLYHVITDWQLYRDQPIEALYIWQGGLGIPGGIIVGVGVGALVARRLGMRLSVGLDVVAPALPLAQAIGRLGNWFNQELYGGPTDLPWGLSIDVAKRPGEYLTVEAFHPTFLYEALWNLGVVAILLAIDKRRSLRPGTLFPLYLGGYFLGRLWIESVRIDPANTIAGLRINTWTSLVALLLVVGLLAARGVRRRPDDSDEPYTSDRELVT